MARELVTEKGIGKRADAVWATLQKQQEDILGTRAKEDSEVVAVAADPLIEPGSTQVDQWSALKSPQNRNLPEEQTGAIIQSLGNPELCARICGMAVMLGYNPARTRMLVGQWRLDLVGLERKLQHELDVGPQISSLGNRGKRSGHLN